MKLRCPSFLVSESLFGVEEDVGRWQEAKKFRCNFGQLAGDVEVSNYEEILVGEIGFHSLNCAGKDLSSSVQRKMEYEDWENYNLTTMLDDDEVDERADNIHLDNKFSLVNHNNTHAEPQPMEEDQSKGFSVFCEQTIHTCANMCGVSVDGLSAKDLNQMADDLSYHVMEVINDCKIQLMMTKQTKLTPKMLKTILLRNYGFRCYGQEVHRFYEMDKNEEESIQKQCEKQFVQLGNSKVKKLYINSEFIYNCMDVEIISYCDTPVFISQMWRTPGIEYIRNPYAHLDKKYFDAILDIVLSNVNIPFIKLVEEFDINRVGLKLVNCVHKVIKEFLNNEVILGRLFDFLIAFANSKSLVSPAYTRICLNLLNLAVEISTKEFVYKDQTLPLSYSIRRKAASLVADMVRHWDICPNIIMDITHHVNRSSPEYKLLSYSGAVHVLAALGLDIFEYYVFFRIVDLFAQIKKLYMSRLEGAKQDRRLNCLNGDLLASDYFEDLALLIRHNNHNTPFKSNSLYLHNPKLVIDVDSFDEDENEIKTEDIKKEVVVPRKRDKDVEDLNALLHISVSHVPRTKNYNCFDNEVIGPILNHFSKVLHLNDKDRQLFVDDIYYRCMHNLLQAHQQSASENKFKLTLSNLRSSLYTYYPSHFVKTHDQVDLYEEFEDYKPVKRYPRIKVKIKNCMQEPEYKLERANPHNRNIYYQEHDTRHMAKYRHQIYCRRKYIQDLKFDFKKHACSSLLSVML
ncbi:hypothetical protein M8J76_014556 [Diaphorina citri]|nr:hypothetical protein M8J76_014556 [Diaphorina citri]